MVLFPNEPDFDTVGTLFAAAVCLLLLEAPECRGKSRLSGDDNCVVFVREMPVPGGEVDRRALVTDIDAELGLITCVWDRIGQMARSHPTAKWHRGFLLIPVSGVDDAEGRVREQVGEEKIGGNGRNGTSKRDMIRDGMILRNTQHLSHTCSHHV